MTDPRFDTEQLLRDRLHRAADDGGRPLDHDPATLLPRARTARRRHALLAASATVAATAVVVGGVVAGISLLHPEVRPTLPAPAASDSPTASPSPERVLVNNNDVVERCRPQLAKYAAYPMFPRHPERTRWLLRGNRDNYVGDLVLLDAAEGGSNPVTCRLPAPGHEHDPVSFASLQPDPRNDAEVLEACSLDPLGKGDGSDLRGGRVLALDHAGPAISALVAQDGQAFACVLSPPTWDAGMTELQVVGRPGWQVSLNGSTTGAGNKSIVGETASYQYGATLLPRSVATVTISAPSGPTRTYHPVDGALAVMFKLPGGGGIPALDIHLYDAQGDLLRSE